MSKYDIKTLRKLSIFTTRSSFLERLRSNDENSWKEFHTRYMNMIRYTGTKRGLSEEECQDLMIEVMVIFWNKMNEFIYDRNKGHFRSYLCKIADFVSLKFMRSGNKKPPVQTLEVSEYPGDIDVGYMEEWQNFLLEKALEELKKSVDTTTFQVFYMLVFQEKDVKEVSYVTRKSASCIYNIRFRCTKKLKGIIDYYRSIEEAEFSLPFPSTHSHKKA